MVARLHPSPIACALGLTLLLGLGLLALPHAEARAAYDGPGMTGTVPRGDGGFDARNLSQGENLTTITITGLPADLCRFELAADLGTHVYWPAPVPAQAPDPASVADDPENGTQDAADYAQEATDDEVVHDASMAKVYAELGTEDAPFEVRAHWLPDLKGNCAVEVDADGTTYHDPWGRPFSKVWGQDPANTHKVAQGGNVSFPVTIGNHGTVPTRIALDTDTLYERWTVTFDRPVANITLGPNETARIVLTVDVPDNERRGFRPFSVWWTVLDTGEHDRFSVPMDVVAAAPPPERAVLTNATALEELAAQRTAEAVVDDVGETEESPLASPLLPVLVLAAAALAASRRSVSRR